MNARPLAGACCLAVALLAAPHAPAEVTVNSANPERFTDIGFAPLDRQRNVQTLERHLRSEGARCLLDGERLELDVFNVDLAGRDEWWHRPGEDLRVMTDVTWPRLELGYVWRDAGGRVLGEGRERVADMNYLLHAREANSDTGRLPYERIMLHDWFEQRLCKDRQQQAVR